MLLGENLLAKITDDAGNRVRINGDQIDAWQATPATGRFGYPVRRSGVSTLHAPLGSHVITIDADPLDDEEKVGECANEPCHVRCDVPLG